MPQLLAEIVLMPLRKMGRLPDYSIANIDNSRKSDTESDEIFLSQARILQYLLNALQNAIDKAGLPFSGENLVALEHLAALVDEPQPQMSSTAIRTDD